MTKNIYECHVTINATDVKVATDYAKSLGFHMSAIEGDEMMGPLTNGYCTKSSDSFPLLYGDMHALVWTLKNNNIPVKREKIEAIIHDQFFQIP